MSSFVGSVTLFLQVVYALTIKLTRVNEAQRNLCPVERPVRDLDFYLQNRESFSQGIPSRSPSIFVLGQFLMKNSASALEVI